MGKKKVTFIRYIIRDPKGRPLNHSLHEKRAESINWAMGLIETFVAAIEEFEPCRTWKEAMKAGWTCEKIKL